MDDNEPGKLQELWQRLKLYWRTLWVDTRKPKMDERLMQTKGTKIQYEAYEAIMVFLHKNGYRDLELDLGFAGPLSEAVAQAVYDSTIEHIDIKKRASQEGPSMHRKILLELLIEEPRTAGEDAENLRRATRNFWRTVYNESRVARVIYNAADWCAHRLSGIAK